MNEEPKVTLTARAAEKEPKEQSLRYRKKPVVIEAFQMTKKRRTDNQDWPEWLNKAWNEEHGDAGSVYPTVKGTGDGTISICTLEGEHLVSWGDWIIQGVQGELYPCKPDIFEQTYLSALACTSAVPEPEEEYMVLDGGHGDTPMDKIYPSLVSAEAAISAELQDPLLGNFRAWGEDDRLFEVYTIVKVVKRMLPVATATCSIRLEKVAAVIDVHA